MRETYTIPRIVGARAHQRSQRRDPETGEFNDFAYQPVVKQQMYYRDTNTPVQETPMAPAIPTEDENNEP